MVRIGMFEAKSYDEESFEQQLVKENQMGVEFVYIPDRLDSNTVDKYATNLDAVCCFVNSDINKSVLTKLRAAGVGLVLLRCAGFDMIDLDAARSLEISVARVPAYSPYGVAEFAASLLMTLNRKVHKAFNRTREGNFTLPGLVGSTLHGKTVGVVGTGKIGRCFADIAMGFGCKILAYDVFESEELKAFPQVTYVTLDELFKNSDFISLHAPLTNETTHLINERTLGLMKSSCILINTSRGKLIDTKALIDALVQKKIAGAGLDVYENEQRYFFSDHSLHGVDDIMLRSLQSLPTVIVTSHQAFLTAEALEAISSTTLYNCKEYFLEHKKLKALTNSVL